MTHQSDAFSHAHRKVNSSQGTDGAEMLFDSVQPNDIHRKFGHDALRLKSHSVLVPRLACNGEMMHQHVPIVANSPYFLAALKLASIAFLASSSVYSWLATPPA